MTASIKEALEQIIQIYERNVGRQNEKLADIPMIAKRALDETHKDEFLLCADAILATGCVQGEASIRADEREKMQASLACLIVENDSEDADDECELCGGRGTVDAYTMRTTDSRMEGRDDIGCPACIERHHSRTVAAAIRAGRGEQ
mgnify:CR=1 FL=1